MRVARVTSGHSFAYSFVLGGRRRSRAFRLAAMTAVAAVGTSLMRPVGATPSAPAAAVTATAPAAVLDGRAVVPSQLAPVGVAFLPQAPPAPAAGDPWALFDG